MHHSTRLLVGAAFAVVSIFGTLQAMKGQAPEEGSALTFDQSGRMVYPSRYREWVYLSSGFNMSYTPKAGANAQQGALFDNVFVDPASYRAFQKSGKWPNGTVLILEIRNGETKGSINQGGHFQSGINHVEAHVKDESRFAGAWAFFGFNGEKNGALLPKSASCYSCHEQHGAVDTTFVQFYPTLQANNKEAKAGR
jgi:hypothetical protein